MPLTLVLGPANSAKAGEVLGAYRLAARSGALLVVPTRADAEHYERELTESGAILGRALTFGDLHGEIARRAGFEHRRLSQLQRQRLQALVLSRLELPSLSRSLAAPGFGRALGHLLAELQQARASAPRLVAALTTWAADQPGRRQYAHDLGAICLRWADELARRGLLDAEGFAWGALDALRARPDSWRVTAVYLYGFDDLTEIELDTVATLAGAAGAQVTVSLTYEPGRTALAARARVVEELRAQAASVRQLPALDDHYEPGSRAALHHLERHLFEPDAEPLDPGDAVQLLEAGGERAEAEQVADEVQAALADGVGANEIVVVCRSPARSAALLERALSRRGIATASARRLPLSHTALGRALLALAVCAFAPERAGADDLLAYLRAPGLAADPGLVDELEARLRRAGVTQLADARRLPGAGALPVADVERLRRAAEPAAGIAEACRRLLDAPHQRRAALLSAPEERDARAAATVLEALAEVAEIDTTAPQLLDLLAGLELPAGTAADPAAVLIAEPLAIRARRFRRVIVTGLCEGEFPSSQAVAGDPFLSDEDRRELALASGLALPLSEDSLARERYLLYACVSRATERVTLSWRSSDEDGALVLPSPFLDDLEQLLGSAWRERTRRRALGELDPRLAGGGKEAVGAEPAGVGAGWAVPGTAQPAPTPRQTRTLGEAARAQIRHTRILSGGALETFAACPVRWLVESQLQPQELRPEPEARARGSFMHEVVERVVATLDGPLTLASLPRAEELLTVALAQARNDPAPGRRPEVRAALLRGIEADLRRWLRHEAATGNGWEPAHVELSFGFDEDSDPESSQPEPEPPQPEREPPHPALLLGAAEAEADDPISLRGRIDRVDIEPGARRAIVRDYKSGRRQPDWAWPHWVPGGRLQVALYMLAVRRLLGLEPVAGLYQQLTGDDLRPRGVCTAGVDPGGNAYANDMVSAAELGELLEQVEREAMALAGRLRRGELTPCPETCSGASGGGCRHPGICWAEA